MNRVFEIQSSGKGIAALWLAVVVSALLVAWVGHLCRQQYAQLSVLQREADQLQVAYGRYLLEQSAWGSLPRVEKTATEKLSMRSPEMSEIVMVKD